MRIKRLRIKNYRQLRDIDVAIEKKNKNDLQVFIGKNGTGKTNFLNAINWCLYNDEPHLSHDSQQLPLLNLQSLYEDNKEKDAVKVEVWIENENYSYILKRKAIYRIYKESSSKKPIAKHEDTNFEVEIQHTNETGDTDIQTLKGDEANSFIERIIPFSIREFYFFDGEKLDRYFREETSQKIQHSVFVISQIDLLDRVRKKFEIIFQEYIKKAGRFSPKIEKEKELLEEINEQLEEIEKDIDTSDSQKRIAKEEIGKCNEALIGVPNIENLENERERAREDQKEKKDILKDKKKEKQDLLIESGTIMMLRPVINDSIKLIKEKRDKKEIPPNIDKSVLMETLDSNNCSVCRRGLDDESKKKIKELLDRIKLSSEILRQLLYIENPLYNFENKMNNFKKEIKRVTEDIKNYKNDIGKIEVRIKEIDRELSGYEGNKIKKLAKARSNFEEIYENKVQELTILDNRKQSLLVKKELSSKMVQEELKKGGIVKELSIKIDFCNRSLEVLKKTKNDILDEVRAAIEAETKKIFFDLIWKKDTFKDLKINDKYRISLIHALDYECLGTISAAEREFLALSFILALHNISGFKSGLIIDTPVARVSDENRENFAKIFSKIGEKKQTILLFTPSEYSKEISKYLDIVASSRYKFSLSSGEKESRLEEL